MSSLLPIFLPPKLLLEFAISGPIGGDWHWNTPADGFIVRAESPIEHVEPAAMAALAAWADFQVARGKRIVVDDSVKSQYAWRYGVLTALAGRTLSSLTGTDFYQPPFAVRDDSDRQRLLTQVSPLLQIKDEAQRNAIWEALSEILRNVTEHAESKRGAYVVASSFPHADRVSLAIVDTGIGVPEHIRQKHGRKLTDQQAIDAALQWRVTGTTAYKPFGGSAGSVENYGIGLYQVRTLATLSGGLMALVSSSAYAKSNGIDEIATGPTVSPWQGTLVAVSFNPSRAQEGWKRRAALERDLSDRKREHVTWGPAPGGVQTIAIDPTVERMVEDKNVAHRIRESVILPEVRAGRGIGIDLGSAKIITHTFVHALLYQAIGLLGALSKERIFVSASEGQVRDVIRMVARYALEDASGSEEHGD